ncbi:MAG: calcium-translocating P-type ATPase, PMCA-type [Clostridiales bacterium]|nr:calcium-translocating P-type ATPase, PMCA-type [Clostridiales bacterium]
MKEYAVTINQTLENLNSSYNGLNESQVSLSKIKHGENKIEKLKNKSIFKRIFSALFEPMLIILEISMFITLGVNLGKFLKTGNGDFYECIGILLSIGISVFLTVYMEGKSQRAFELLQQISSDSFVKVVRNGEKTIIKQSELVVGDIVMVSSGDKVFADGRILSCNFLSVDESTLTGESLPVKKNADIILNESVPLAERVNMLYSGTFIVEGEGVYVVTAVGNNAEMGLIASDLQKNDGVSAPLQEKLDRLSKTITFIGVTSAVFVLILTIARLICSRAVTFSNLQETFLSAIVLIVASVPEGLPTTVAIALTLNVVKLSKSNALIKKLVATETVGCVSVICSDKTGTLTENKMKVEEIFFACKDSEKFIKINSLVNSTAYISKEGEVGSPTELALIKRYLKQKESVEKYRSDFNIINPLPFSSELKYSSITILDGESITYIKGAPEKIYEFCLKSPSANALFEKIKSFQSERKRVIAFAHSIDTSSEYVFDGFAVICDPVRKDVKQSVLECKRAGISVKMLTGDNFDTAFSIARELNLTSDRKNVVLATEIEKISDEKLKLCLPNIAVVARSTPKTKLRIVKLLKEMGEVVAVTGDGVNDAPAIRHADIGISMGNGSEITKEASDIILLDNSFSTIVTAINFGRNVYQNFQRFIMFQLSVNFTAVTFIVISLILGVESPFTTVQLLWINLIMDGPPALTLGLESRGRELMSDRPVKRSDDIVSKKMLLRILIHAGFMCAILMLQYKVDFLGCGERQMKTALFSLFILFQLFNAFNARELGSTSVFKNLKSNKPMLVVFFITFILQVVFSEFLGGFFGTVSLPIITWIKIILTAFSIILLSESYKLVKRLIKNKNNA